MLRCDKCKYQELPSTPSYPPFILASTSSIREVFANVSRKIKAQLAYCATPESRGEHCYQCGYVFGLDDTRWEGNSYKLTYGGYVRTEPRKIWSIRVEMFTRADNGNQEARDYLANLDIEPPEWEGFAAARFAELMENMKHQHAGRE